jgi:hypothetical protein
VLNAVDMRSRSYQYYYYPRDQAEKTGATAKTGARPRRVAGA